MRILETVTLLERAELVSNIDIESVRTGESSGISGHTIGFETEVLGTAINDVPTIKDLETDEEMFYLAETNVGRFGFGVGNDGVYEIQSPPARHPKSLAIAAKGLAKAGFLPTRTKTGLVTAHVSIGSLKIDSVEDTPGLELIRILRATELNDGTTPRRITAPLEQDGVSHQAWNTRGTVGVSVNQARPHTWVGPNKRIEFRSLGYYSPVQFERTLKMVYFLSRGYLAGERTEAHKIYTDYSDWFKDYCERHNLPDLGKEQLVDAQIVDLEEYLVPYSEHLAQHGRRQLKEKTNSTVNDLAEEFSMSI